MVSMAAPPSSERKESKTPVAAVLESRSGTLRKAGSASVLSPKAVLQNVGSFSVGFRSDPDEVTPRSSPASPTHRARWKEEPSSPKSASMRQQTCSEPSEPGRQEPSSPKSPSIRRQKSSEEASEPRSIRCLAALTAESKSPRCLRRQTSDLSGLASEPISPKSPKKIARFKEEARDLESKPRLLRRASLPCLKVATKRPGSAETGRQILTPGRFVSETGTAATGSNDTGKVLRRGKGVTMERRVSFGDGMELFEAFTPYCKKYGAHPDDFFFDEKGHMVLVTSSQSDVDLLNVKPDDTIECIAERVDYHTKPQLSARHSKKICVALGEQVLVKKRCGEWVQDSRGWLPVLLKNRPAFQVVVPKEQLRYATSRVGVMAASDDVSPDKK